ncbi:MAG: RNA-directed DNA polymerase [Pseudomonadota bacterium]|nr:RNA-directed DNA polymerase [Pseudomonadota bacterium]
MTERNIDLVVPLAQETTDMRITDTTGKFPQSSGAVSLLIGESLRQGDVDSTMRPGIRTSTMETRITTTPTTKCVPGPFANQTVRFHADFSFEELTKAYFDCRENKRNSQTALLFEQDLEHNLFKLYEDLINGVYTPGKSICFVITHPKPREVWAAEFRDRIVHHLLYNHISPRFYASFIADSCACIPGRGTLYAVKRLESKIRSITQNWSKEAYYLKMDLANFFVSIDKQMVHTKLAEKISEPWWLQLADTVLFHDPRQNFEYRGNPERLNRVPSHKRLGNHPSHLGLPIGNLSSQFFANVLLDAFDQHCKHQLHAKHYIRYVDDFILLHESKQWLNDVKRDIESWLPENLSLHVNPSKTILQPIERGVDFVGQLIKPWNRSTRKRTVYEAIRRINTIPMNELFEVANSYFGLLRQAQHSHHDRALLSNALRRRGYTIKSDLTKTYRRTVQVERKIA